MPWSKKHAKPSEPQAPRITCPLCNGQGADINWGKDCPACAGKGYVQDPNWKAEAKP